MLTFKDLKKRVSLEATTEQKYALSERLQNKPFWIWSIEEHKNEDVRTNGDCCFNHVIGLPQKNDVVSNRNNNQVYHMPRSTGFESFGDDGKSTRLPVTQILNEASSHISKYGYSVIVMHPTSFLVMQNGKYTKTVDEKEIDDLKTLIESIKSKNIHITSFSKLAGMSG